MGAGNVKLVYARWPELPHAPFRALVYMALVAKDNDDPPRFWGGREALALALGVIVPAEVPGDKDVTKARRIGFKRVDRSIGDLTAAGAVAVESVAYFRHNAVYVLNLAGRMDPGERGPTSTERTPVSGVHEGTAETLMHPGERGPMHPGERVERTPVSGTLHPGERGPKEEKEEGRTEVRNESADLETAVTGPRARAPETTPDQIPTKVNGRRFTRTDRASQAIAEAQARVAARRAAHAAELGLQER